MIPSIVFGKITFTTLAFSINYTHLSDATYDWKHKITIEFIKWYIHFLWD